jgi:hypothetical protein
MPTRFGHLDLSPAYAIQQRRDHAFLTILPAVFRRSDQQEISRSDNPYGIELIMGNNRMGVCETGTNVLRFKIRVIRQD